MSSTPPMGWVWARNSMAAIKIKMNIQIQLFQTLSVTQFSRDYQKRNLHVSFYTVLKRLRWGWDHSFYSFTLHFCKFHVRILLQYKLNRLRPIIIGYLYNIHCFPINKAGLYFITHSLIYNLLNFYIAIRGVGGIFYVIILPYQIMVKICKFLP